jgi:hypothetical protein
MKMWRVSFFFCGGTALVFVICWKFFKDIRTAMPEHEFKRSGLEGLLSRYQAEKSTAMTVIWAPLLFLICLYFTRNWLSFAACLSALIGGLFLITGLSGGKYRIAADFRELASNLALSGDSAGKSVLFETLDGEVRRGEIIAYAARVYYLYPSALIAARSNLSPTPRIIPTKDIVSVTHKITHHTAHRNALSPPGRPYDLFRVCVYGQHEEKLGEVVCHEDSDAQFLIKALNRNFGVANLGITSVED